MKWIFICLSPFIFLECRNKERALPRVTSITESVYASGVVKAEKQYKVYPDVSGILKKKHISIGDLVKEGDSLFAIDNMSAMLNAENAALKLKRSRENLKKLKELQRQTEISKIQYEQDSLMYARQQNLWKNNIGTKVALEDRRLSAKKSQSAYLNSMNQYNQLRSDLHIDYETARNDLRISEKQKSDYIVRCGVDGRIFTIFPEEGEYISPQTQLAVIGMPENFYLEMEVDESDIGKVKDGQQVYISLESHADTLYKAKIRKIHPIMNEGASTFTIEGDFIQTPFRLYPNLSLEANIVVNQKPKAMVIPRDYLVNDSFVLAEDGRKVKVDVGLKNFQYAEIVRGLQPGQWIYKP